MVIYIILYAFVLYFYGNDNKVGVLFSLTTMLFNCFGFVDSSDLILKPSVFTVSFTFVVSLLEGWKHKNYFNVKNDALSIVILAIIGYSTFCFLISFITGKDTLANTFNVVFQNYTLLLYFYFRKMRYSEFVRFFKMVIGASVVQGVFYYLQLVGVDGVLTGRVGESSYINEMTRYANYPLMTTFIAFYYVISDEVKTLKLFMIPFFGMMLVIGQMRGEIILLGLSCAIFFFMKRKIKYVTYIIVAVLAFQFIINPMFEYRSRNATNSTFEEIKIVLSDPTNMYNYYIATGGKGGTMAFRFAMLMERVQFMADNPRYLPTGVGCIGENSPNNNFNFIIGTHSEKLDKGISMLNSADIVWVGVLMYYGLIGVILFLLFYYFWARDSLPCAKNSNKDIFVAASIFSVSSFLISFNSDPLRAYSLIVIVFYLSVIYSCKRYS